MSKFVTKLEVELLDDTSNEGRGTWRLTAPLIYQSDLCHGPFYVPAGFCTDFASVPRLPVAFLLTADSCHAASALHDWLYSTHPVPRATADALLKEASLTSGVPSWRCWSMYLGVRVFGAKHWVINAAQK